MFKPFIVVVPSTKSETCSFCELLCVLFYNLGNYFCKDMILDAEQFKYTISESACIAFGCAGMPQVQYTGKDVHEAVSSYDICQSADI